MMELRIGAVVLASGDSRRFGPENKLLAPFHGKPLLAHVLEALPESSFARRLVVTRYPEVAQLAQSMGFEALLHELPDVSDTIRLGTRAMEGMEGCLFAVGDQPLLTAESVTRLVEFFCLHPESIVRAAKDGQGGNPAIFPPAFYDGLCALPPGRGGNELMKRFPQRVLNLEVRSPGELFDIDTQKEYRQLCERT